MRTDTVEIVPLQCPTQHFGPPATQTVQKSTSVGILTQYYCAHQDCGRGLGWVFVQKRESTELPKHRVGDGVCSSTVILTAMKIGARDDDAAFTVAASFAGAFIVALIIAGVVAEVLSLPDTWANFLLVFGCPLLLAAGIGATVNLIIRFQWRQPALPK